MFRSIITHLGHTSHLHEKLHTHTSTPPPAVGVPDSHWQQAQLSPYYGGLGFRSLAHHSPAAFISSLASSGLCSPNDIHMLHFFLQGRCEVYADGRGRGVVTYGHSRLTLQCLASNKYHHLQVICVIKRSLSYPQTTTALVPRLPVC